MPPIVRVPRFDELRRIRPNWWEIIGNIRPWPAAQIRIDDFDPLAGQAAERMVIRGSGFSATRDDNDVQVAGYPAFVVDAEPDRLVVLLHPDTVTGPVTVTVDGHTATGPVDYEVLRYPAPDEDGPPVLFAGAGSGLAGDLPSTGTARVLVVLVAPDDEVPADPAAVRQDVVAKWDTVRTFYDQASYGRLDLQVDLTSSWTTLTGSSADYLYEAGHDSFPNVDQNAMPQLMAEAARAAQADGFDLDDYGMMAVVLHLDGGFIRAWGGWSQQNFSATDFDGTAINITASQSINLLVIGESAHWGRFAHETGHNIVSVPTSTGPGAATLGEDVYASDLVDPAAATAEQFEMMGSHDGGPLFSAYHMKTLGWYTTANIRTLQWDRNAFSQEIEVVAHGLTEDTTSRVHVVEIRVTDSLSYFVEVRQQPGTTAQVFDPSIPVAGSPELGGVVVTRAISGTINNNQQTRFITLLHDQRVLREGQVATDPARDLRITVLDEDVVARPLVCRVRVEWAQTQVDDPNGAFDLRVDPWDGGYQTPDIWVDRDPFGSFDQGMDAEGRPLGNGDRPRPLEINQLFSRVHNDGVMDAASVRVTLYAVTPPGVGDNGNWSPLQTVTVPAITAAGFQDVAVDWVPVVGDHTCLKVYAERQLGEISGGNNMAQENVFEFEAPASSPPDPVVMPVAVRNPSPDRRLPVSVTVDRVPEGFLVHLDHSWVWLDPLGERTLELWVVPMLDIESYLRKREIKEPSAPVRITGRIARDYETDALRGKGEPVGSVLTSIGGITARVTPKRRGAIELRDAKEDGATVYAVGRVQPAVEGTRVDVAVSGRRGRVGWATTETNEDGIFGVPVKVDDKPLRVQAFVVDAAEVSECESNVIYLGHRNGNGSGPLDPLRPLDR